MNSQDEEAARRIVDLMDTNRRRRRSGPPSIADAYEHLFLARFDEALSIARGLPDTPYTVAVRCQIEALCTASTILPEQPAADPGTLSGAMAAFHLSEAAHVVGDFDRCATLLSDALDQGIPDPRARTWVWLSRTRALIFRGAVSEADAELRRAEAEASTLNARESARCLRAMVAGFSGDRSAVIEVAERIRRAILTPHTYAHSGIALLAAYGLAASGFPRSAADLLRYGAGGPRLPLLPLALRAYGFDMLIEAALSRGRLELADWTLLDFERLDLGGNDQLESARATARARVDIARGDEATGAARARDAGRLALETGSTMVGARAALAAGDDILDSATSADLRGWLDRALDAVGRRRSGQPNWGSLTAGQLQVARLAARGLRNQEIADVLVVSLRTVESHVAAILGTLGVESRVGIVVHGTPTAEPDVETLGGLSRRQRDVALLLLDGFPNAEIASRLGVGVKAVEAQVSSVMRRLGAGSRAAVVARLRSSESGAQTRPSTAAGRSRAAAIAAGS